MLDERPENITDRGGLNDYLGRDTSRPRVPSIAEFATLDDATLAALNDARLEYICDGLTVTSEPVLQTLRKAKAMMLLNKRARAGRKSVLISGRATTGKTKACLALMRAVWVQFRVENPDTWNEATPVAYVNVPPDCTRKGLMRRFADFYRLEYTPRMNADLLYSLVVNAMRRERTVLSVVDELHNLGPDKAGGISVDTLKDLANAPLSTFVFAGTDVAARGLLSGPRGEQLSGRCARVRTSPYSYEKPEDRAVWDSLIAGFARQLPLAANDPAELTAHSAWLHEVTLGYIGSLHSMLAQAVTSLIAGGDPGSETVTREILEQTVSDMRAEPGGLAVEELFETVIE